MSTTKTKAASKPGYECTECGWLTVRWVGRCGECQAWGSVIEKGGAKLRHVPSQRPVKQAVPISEVLLETSDRSLTGIGELDRVLGGGLVPGAVVLLAGEPGVGKSTLLLEVAAKWSKLGRRTLYVSGEESAAQVRLRAERTDALSDNLYLAAEDDLGTILGHIEQTDPTLMVLDSVQTVGTSESDGSPGGVAQVKEVTGALVRVAKTRNMPVLIVGHVTKDGAIAGPRTLEHLVDVVLAFEGDRHNGLRLVRATKNRFGSADEVGCFELVSNGIAEVSDPSGLFISAAAPEVSGTCVTVTMEGRRPLLAEVQALLSPALNERGPRRVISGVDGQRSAMILAVLQQRCRMPIGQLDCHIATVGGARVFEPSSDLAIATAVASSFIDRVSHAGQLGRTIALGEIGLAGELRRVPGLERRLSEASRLGFDSAIVPAQDFPTLPKLNLDVRPVPTVMAAMQVLQFAS